METKPYLFNDLRRAAEERRKAAAALTEAARRTHLELAAIFEARAGIVPAVTDGCNVIQLRPKSARGRAAATAAAAPEAVAATSGGRRRSTRARSRRVQEA